MQSKTAAASDAPARKFDVLEAARGLSALVVVLSHARAFVMNDYGPHASSIAGKAFYFVSGLGHAAVIVFFVLSGFLITGSVVRSKESGRWNWRSYLIARIGRLHTVAIPCLILTLIIDYTTASATHSKFYYGTLQYYGSGPTDGGIHLDIFTFLANVAFLQTIAAPVYGSNGPLWSLASEFWYYIIFPLSYTVTSTGRIWKIPSDYAIAFTVVLIGIITNISLLALYGAWFMGRISRQYCDSRQFERHNTAIGIFSAALAVVAIGVARFQILTPVIADIALASALAALFLATSDAKIYPSVFPVFSAFSRVSYSTYLIHFPVLASLASVALDNKRMDFGLTAVLSVCGFCLVSLAAGAGVYSAFETRTERVKSWIDDRTKAR